MRRARADLRSYILNDQGNPIPATDSNEWARWMYGPSNRLLRKDELCGMTVSTVFLGLDHNYGNGDPILWETMIFGLEVIGILNEYQDRYSTREEAEKGHQKAIRFVKNHVGHNYQTRLFHPI
jgi:hypothetical protein